MSQASTTAQAVRETRRELAMAGDAQVLAVTSMVDRLEDRGDADALLAPVRARLRSLRPKRPLRFSRLMFTPLDPLIVDPSKWRPGSPFVPRSALTPLEKIVRRGNAANYVQVDAILAQINKAAAKPSQKALIATLERQASEMIWPRAAAAALAASTQPAPVLWLDQGLSAAEFPSLTAGVATILGAAATLNGLADGSQTPDQLDAALDGLLSAAEVSGDRAWAMLLSLLMLRFPQSQAPHLAAARAAGRPDRALRAGAAAASEAALAWVETGARGAGVGAADAATVKSQIAVLAALTDSATDPEKRREVANARQQLQANCVQRFESGLRERLTDPLRNLADTAPGLEPATRGAMLGELESGARALRGFETQARVLGGGKQFDKQLTDAAATVTGAKTLAPVERARLVDILAGPHAALRVLREG